MDYKITEVFLDLANKYRVRVMISDNESMFFKFNNYPSQEEVNYTVENYLQSKLLNNEEIIGQFATNETDTQPLS